MSQADAASLTATELLELYGIGSEDVDRIRKLGELGWVTGPTAEQWDHAQLIEFGKAIRGTHFGRGPDRIVGFHLPLLQSTEHRSRRTPFREQPP